MNEIQPGWRWVPTFEGRYLFDETGRVGKVKRDRLKRECIQLLMCREGQRIKLKPANGKSGYSASYVDAPYLISIAAEESVVFHHTDGGASASSPSRCLKVVKFSKDQIEAWDDQRSDRGICRQCQWRSVSGKYEKHKLCKPCGNALGSSKRRSQGGN